MSNDGIIDELTYIAKLLYELPQAICDEMEKRQVLREEIIRQENIAKIQMDMDFYAQNLNQINKMMYGCQNYKVDNNNEGIQPLEDLKRSVGQDGSPEQIISGKDSGSS